ncbi:MAG: prolyl oligopeptidase family serine peptidase [Thermoguttaceae bacterium]|nr:prolyl oligopeptidase family serine peptidase [Thermoguttaceae bacterium]
MNRKQFFTSLIVAALTAATALCSPTQTLAQETPAAPVSTFPGKVGQWNGFQCNDFQFQGRAAKLVFPKEAAPGKPWIWRARFFGHEPQFDVAMLNRGYAVAYINSAPLMGSPKSVALWQDFYLYLTKEHGFAKKTNLEGMSRGGLYTVNWAMAYPEQVATIYIDNPVLDFKSWPGGYGEGKRSDGDWNSVLQSYELTQEEAMKYSLNPIDNTDGQKKMAAAKVGVFLVCGDSDRVVPFPENAKLFKERYEAVGGPVELILKPGNDHHPHSLKDPTPIVEFVEKFNK